MIVAVLASTLGGCAPQQSPHVATVPTSAPAPADPRAAAPESFNAAQVLEAWSFSNGPEWPGARGHLERRDTGGRSGDGVLVLHYDFENGGNYVAACVNLPTDPPVQAVRLWVRKPSGNLMTFRATDSAGETFQKNLSFTYPDWQQLEITLDGWVHHWGGDGVFQGPATRLDILIENSGGNRSGELWIDDVQWTYARPERAATTTRTTTYVESEFGASDGWTYRGPSGGGFDGGQWTYQFNARSGRCGVAGGGSILGRPTALRLTVESDGSGHELTATCGSHFQFFDRTLGRLDTAGVQTFEVPLGDMQTWKHSGGEDDGVVRYPVRLEEIGLVQRGTAPAGHLRLVRLEYVTEFEADQAVALVPSVSSGDGEQLFFTVTLRSLRDEPLSGELHYTLTAFDRSIRSGSIALTVPAGGPRIATEIPAAFGDETMLEGRFRFVAGAESTPEQSTTIARPGATSEPYTLDPASRMGVGVYLYRFHEHPEARAMMERMCKLAAGAGVKWTREEFHWNWIEPVKGHYDFSFFDQLVDTATAHGISVYGLMCYWTIWNPPPLNEAFIDDYCHYLRAVVGRYKDRIKYWEIWNEPNIFFWPAPKELYAQLLQRAYETIKEVDPAATVLGCSTAGIDTAFIKLVLEHQAPFDAVTVHPYRADLDPAGFIRELRATRDLVGGRDVWITEMGWPSHLGGLTEREQAGYVARTYVSAFASGVARTVAWYNFREDGTDPYYNEHHFGLIRQDLTPKIGYRALAAVGPLLGSAEYEGDLMLGEDLTGFVFRAGERRIAAVWSSDATRLVRFELDPANAAVLNTMNEPASCVRKDATVVLRLERGLPVYICADRTLSVKRLPAPVDVVVERTAVHPGERVTVQCRIEAGAAVGSPVLPAQWSLAGETPGTAFTVIVPDEAPPGTAVIVVPVEHGGVTFDVPVRIDVVPVLMRG